MGNYSGTTRCGYCGERGHNRAGCQHLKRRVERERVENPDSWLVRSEDEKARKQLLQFFEAWGPTDEATLSGRRQLSALLFA